MRSVEEQNVIRQDVFRWLDDLQFAGKYEFTRDELTQYHFDGIRIPLLDRGRGIRNPADFSSTLSIMTSSSGPYSDTVGAEMFLTYDYREGDSADNRKLRAAYIASDPLIYFERIRKGTYVAQYPVYVVADNEDSRTFTIALDQDQKIFGDPLVVPEDLRRYSERTYRARLHQPAFRARVLRAYKISCAICQLGHASLLDAAHIIPDSHVDGFARVDNGLALCKIHHRAYDLNLMGISPDYVVHVREDVLQEVGSSMLRHGIQEMNGRSISTPRIPTERPLRDSLSARFMEYQSGELATHLSPK